MATGQPSLSPSLITPSEGISHQNGMCKVAINAPLIKPTSVIAVAVVPPPTWKSVPEAQAPPSCMPIQKITAPVKTDTLTGASAPPTVSLSAKMGANNTVASANINI